MRKTLTLFTAAVLLTGTALAGSAVARDRSDRPELTANQMTDQAAARAAELKADLRLTPDQDKNWSAFEVAVVETWKNQTEQRLAWRDAHAKQQDNVDMIEEMRKEADAQIDRANARKKLADASQPLYNSLDDQQKRRFSAALFRRDQ
jgi:LTXXQ motif family protein